MDMTPPSAPDQVLYLAGTGHSGSTLVSFVLNSHPDIFSIGIMSAPTYPLDEPRERRCSCGRRLVECPFFLQMKERFDSDGLPFDPSRWDFLFANSDTRLIKRFKAGSLRSNGLEGLRDSIWRLHSGYRRALELCERSNRLFIASALSISGASIFFDASKDPMRIRFLRDMDGLKLKVLHLVRDPRGLAYSRMRDAGLSPWRAADGWVRTNTNVERHLSKMSRSDWLRVRYEDFCSRTDETLQLISEFVGIRRLEEPTDIRGVEHHIMGNKMRLPENATSSIRLDEQWRERLTEEDLAIIVGRTKQLAESYGYDMS